METLEYSLVCRLCGQQSSISINIFDKTENHVKKINAILPIMVHEMDLLPKHMCHRCSYKLEEFHKFYVDCLKTDANLKGQLSWMRADTKKRVGVPMVYIENIVKPVDYDAYYLNPVVNNVNYINSVNSVNVAPATYERCRYCCDKTDQSERTVPASLKSAVSRCDRLNNVKTENDDEQIIESQAVITNRVESNAVEESSSLRMNHINETDSQMCTSTSSDFCADSAKITSDDRSSYVLNLTSQAVADNVGSAKRYISPEQTVRKPEKRLKYDVTSIKLEKLDGFQNRLLRPRRKTINYKELSLRTSLSNIIQNEKSRTNNLQRNKLTVRNIAKKLELTSQMKQLENMIKFEIKQEQLSDIEDTIAEESVVSAVAPNLLTKRETSDDVTEKIITLPADLVRIQSGSINSSTLKRPRRGATFHKPSKFKSFRGVSNSKVKLEKGNSNTVFPVCYSPIHLRSKDAFLRNGKARQFNALEISVRKSQRRKTVKGSLINATNKLAPSVKLIEKIKQYCEECNICFPSKEIFNLHTCYH